MMNDPEQTELPEQSPASPFSPLSLPPLFLCPTPSSRRPLFLDGSAMTDGGSDLMSNDPNINPHFYTFNKVYLPYCSGYYDCCFRWWRWWLWWLLIDVVVLLFC